MLKRKLGLLVAAAVMVGMFTSCVNVIKNGNGNDNQPAEEETPAGNGIDYTDYSGRDYSIKVENNCSSKVVCFVGEPAADTLISGAVGGSKTTALKKTSMFGTTSFDFILNVVTEENYLKYKDNYSEMANNILCRIYAYYNSNAEANNNLIYRISSKLGGEYYFQLNNTTNYNCELRKDGLFGEPFCYSGAQTLKTKIYAQADDYDFYPVFRKFDSYSGSILTSYPKTNKGNPQRVPVGLGGNNSVVIINCKDFFTDNFTMTASTAFLKVDNQINGQVGVKLFQGASAGASVTDTGIATINSGNSATFTIKMEKTNESAGTNTEYEVQKTIKSWKIGPEGEAISIPEMTFEAGYRYVLIVEGDSYDDISCHFDTYANDAEDGSYKEGDVVRYKVSL